MKQNKYHLFAVTLKNGKTIITKSPVGKVTEKYALLLCYHWVNIGNINNNVKQSDVENIKGMK